MNKDEKRALRRKRLMDNKAYQTMNGLTRYMDLYYLDALIGIIPGWGDAIALLSVVPFIYYQAGESASLAVSHRPHRPASAHSPDDMGTRQLRQLPVFIGSIHLLNCQCLTEFKELAA